MDPNRKVALVTGGTRGIGLEAARHLARCGYRVVITGRSASGAMTSALSLLEAEGGSPIGLELNLEVLQTAESLIARVLGAAGRLDLVIQNAVYQGALNQQRIFDLPLGELDLAWRASITAPVAIVRDAFMHMQGQSTGGRILVVGSGAGRYDPPSAADQGGWGYVYGASKAALHRLAGVMLAERPQGGVVIMTVNPGVVDTPALRATLGLDADLVKKLGAQSAGAVGEIFAWLAVQAPSEQWNGRFVDLQRLAWKGPDQGLV